MTLRGDKLQSLYQEIVLKHSRSPLNVGRLDEPSAEATGHNPLCGDKITVYLHSENDALATLRFESTACAICTASASVMTELVDNKDHSQARTIVGQVLQALNSEDSKALPGEMAAFEGVRRYPSRIKCATLPWQTLDAALNDSTTTTTTTTE